MFTVVQTKEKALKKADQMTPHVGYAKEILDDELIQQFYQEINLKPYLKKYTSSQNVYSSYQILASLFLLKYSKYPIFPISCTSRISINILLI